MIYNIPEDEKKPGFMRIHTSLLWPKAKVQQNVEFGKQDITHRKEPFFFSAFELLVIQCYEWVHLKAMHTPQQGNNINK